MITLEEITRKYMRAFPEKFTQLDVEEEFDEELITLGEMDAKKNFESLRRDRDMLIKLDPKKYG